MTRCPRVLLHSKDMQQTALTAEEKNGKKGDHIRATKNPGGAGRAAKCRCRPAATLLRRWAKVLRIKPLDLVIGELRHSSVRDHGLATLGKLEVEPDPQACPVLTTTHRARRASDISTRPVHPAMLMCLMSCETTVGSKSSRALITLEPNLHAAREPGPLLEP